MKKHKKKPYSTHDGKKNLVSGLSPFFSQKKDLKCDDEWTGAYSGMIVYSRGKKKKRKTGSANETRGLEAVADIMIVLLIGSFFKKGGDTLSVF